ncbi:hypothetical protein, partial [Phytopseudomonas daroniae]
MNTSATVVALTGQAWAQSANGERRELHAGDRLQGDEILITAPGVQVDLDFGDNRVLSLVGEQDVTLDESVAEVRAAQPVQPLEQSRVQTQATAGQGEIGAEPVAEGHGFVQLVRIGEIIEADGVTPLTLARIREVLRPLGMSLPDHEFGNDEWREHRGGDHDESGPASRAPGLTIELQGAGSDGVYNEAEIGPDGTVTAVVSLDDKVREGDRLVIKDGDGNVLLDRPVTAVDLRDGVPVEVPVVPGQSEVRVEAIITTPQGFSGSSRDDKPVDNDVPGVTVELQGAGPDGVYNEVEIGPDGSVPALVTLDDKVKVGDTLLVTDKDGNTLLERPVTQGDLDNG